VRGFRENNLQKRVRQVLLSELHLGVSGLLEGLGGGTQACDILECVESGIEAGLVQGCV
jgi:hypothetical protein